MARITGQTKTTPTVQQNVSGTSDTIGFFPYAWPEYDMVKPGWTVVQIPGSTVVSVDGTYHVITITGGIFTSGAFYTFTGKTGLRINGGLKITKPGIGSDNKANQFEPNATAWVLMDGPFYNSPGVPGSGFVGGQSWRKMAPFTTTNGKTDYIYGDERVYWDGANWIYLNINHGIISAGIGGNWPWESHWSDNYTGAKITASYAKSTNYPAVP